MVTSRQSWVHRRRSFGCRAQKLLQAPFVYPPLIGTGIGLSAALAEGCSPRSNIWITLRLTVPFFAFVIKPDRFSYLSSYVLRIERNDADLQYHPTSSRATFLISLPFF